MNQTMTRISMLTSGRKMTTLGADTVFPIRRKVVWE
jgi:hypothetical protein